MARAAGATFVARTTTYHVQQMAGHHPKGHPARGLFGGGGDEPVPDLLRPQEQAGGAVDMMKRMKDITTPIGSKKKAENPELIERGIFRPGGSPSTAASTIKSSNGP
jgi:2-oxoglutarate ferredoxin oxidoreductase subunit beta